MLAFNKMWDDVCEMLSRSELKNVNVAENYEAGFVVKEDGVAEFISKEDFVDVWCRMLYFNEISQEDAVNGSNSHYKYVYNVIRQLPYICENCGILKIAD